MTEIMTRGIAPIVCEPKPVVVELQSKAQPKNNNNNPQTVVDLAGTEVLLLSAGLRPVGLCRQFAARYGSERVREVVDAAGRSAKQNAAGWIRQALLGEWEVTPRRSLPAKTTTATYKPVPRPTPEELRRRDENSRANAAYVREKLGWKQ